MPSRAGNQFRPSHLADESRCERLASFRGRLARTFTECFAVIVTVLGLAACDRSGSRAPVSQLEKPAASTAGDAEKVLNVYNWTDYIAPGIVQEFEKDYGIKVNYDTYDSNEVLETKLLAGRTGYDVVVPSAPYFERQLKAGVYQKLDKAQLPNLKDIDPEIVSFEQIYDPGNEHGVVYAWLNITGIGFDSQKIRARAPDAPTESWRMVFDPAMLAKVKDCGVAMIDAPFDVVDAALIYLGKEPGTENVDDLRAVETLLLPIRKYVRYIATDRYIDDFANGEICLALGWSGDVIQARERAREAGKPVSLVFSIPREGSLNGADILAIPVGAPHPRNAHLFLNFILRPEIEAKNTNLFRFANPVPASLPFLTEAVRNDRVIYPPADVRAKLLPERSRSLQYTRLVMRVWTRFKTGT